VALVDFAFAALAEAFPAIDLLPYMVPVLSVCVLHRLHVGHFVPALFCRDFFLLRCLISCGFAAPALLLMFFLFIAPDQLGFVRLRSVLMVSSVLVRMRLLCAFLISLDSPSHIVARCVVLFRLNFGRHFLSLKDVLFLSASYLLVRLCGPLHVSLLLFRYFLHTSSRIVRIAIFLFPLHTLVFRWHFLLTLGCLGRPLTCSGFPLAFSSSVIFVGLSWRNSPCYP